MDTPSVVGSVWAGAIYERLKREPPERLRSEGRAAMARLSEQRVLNESRHIAERARRVDPIRRELVAAVRNSPELVGLAGAVDGLDKTPRRSALPPPPAHRFAPVAPMARHGSIHIVDAPPFFADTWTWQQGTSNEFVSPPTADQAGN